MLDTNDIQIIAQTVKESVAENNSAIRKDMEEALSKQREEIQAELAGALSKQKKEIHEELVTALSEQKDELRKEIREDVMTIIESNVTRKLLILAEDNQSLLEKIKRVEKNDEVIDRIVILEEAVKKLNKEVEELKRAQ